MEEFIGLLKEEERIKKKKREIFNDVIEELYSCVPSHNDILKYADEVIVQRLSFDLITESKDSAGFRRYFGLNKNRFYLDKFDFDSNFYYYVGNIRCEIDIDKIYTSKPNGHINNFNIFYINIGCPYFTKKSIKEPFSSFIPVSKISYYFIDVTVFIFGKQENDNIGKLFFDVYKIKKFPLGGISSLELPPDLRDDEDKVENERFIISGNAHNFFGIKEVQENMFSEDLINRNIVKTPEFVIRNKYIFNRLYHKDFDLDKLPRDVVGIINGYLKQKVICEF